MEHQNQLLDVLTREGVLINVSIRYWRAAKKLRPEDIGLDPENVTQRLISLGHKRLVPKESLKTFGVIEGRAHALVEANTFPFLGGLGHFLPNARLEEVMERLRSLEDEFADERDRFLGRYDILRTEAAREWYQAARKLTQDPDRLMESINASFPRITQMYRYFGFETHLFEIKVPDGMSLELTNAADQHNLMVARQRAAAEASEKIARDVNAFVGDCVASLRFETARLCDEMLETMQTGKTGVHQKTLNRLAKFIDQFKDMNFAGDRELEEHLRNIRERFLTRTAEEYRADMASQIDLRSGIKKLANTARELAMGETTAIVEQFGRLGKRKFNLVA